MIFCFTRIKAADVFEWLCAHYPQIPTKLFTKLNSKEEKKMIIDAAKAVTTNPFVIVGTNAFGTGVNIPHVRNIVLYYVPDPDEVAQLLGRGGRDLAEARVRIFTCHKDKENEMTTYLKTKGCLRKFLVGYFDDQEVLPPSLKCCSSCHPQLLLEEEVIEPEKDLQIKPSKDLMTEIEIALTNIKLFLDPDDPVVEFYSPDGLLTDENIKELAKNPYLETMNFHEIIEEEVALVLLEAQLKMQKEEEDRQQTEDEKRAKKIAVQQKKQEVVAKRERKERNEAENIVFKEYENNIVIWQTWNSNEIKFWTEHMKSQEREDKKRKRENEKEEKKQTKKREKEEQKIEELYSDIYALSGQQDLNGKSIEELRKMKKKLLREK